MPGRDGVAVIRARLHFEGYDLILRVEVPWGLVGAVRDGYAAADTLPPGEYKATVDALEVKDA